MPRSPAPDDDAALRWDEFNDPSYVESDAALSNDTALNDTAFDDAALDDTPLDDAARDSDAQAHAATASDMPALGVKLLTGLFALVYLAYSVGWIIGVSLVPADGPTLLIEVMYQFSEFLAMLASALWFAAVIALTRGGRAVHRFGWLALGTLVLIPWPIVLGVMS